MERIETRPLIRKSVARLQGYGYAFPHVVRQILIEQLVQHLQERSGHGKT